MRAKWCAPALALGLLATGCARASPSPAAPAAPKVVAVTNIRAELDAVDRFLTASDLTVLDPAAVGDKGDYTGTLTITAVVGRTSVSTMSNVEVSRAGAKDSLSVTVRSVSTDPTRLLDVLHRPTNAERDYLLTGKAYRAIVPTDWAVVPQQFGTGLGCQMPGRSVACALVDLLEKNQSAQPELPVNSASTRGATVTLSSALTVRQLVGLADWPLPTASKALLATATAAELDRTLIGVTLTYGNGATQREGRLTGFAVSGSFTLAGTAASARLTWTDGNDQKLIEAADSLPVPTRALYTPLTAAQAKALAALAAKR